MNVSLLNFDTEFYKYRYSKHSKQKMLVNMKRKVWRHKVL